MARPLPPRSEWLRNRWTIQGDLHRNLLVAHDGYWQRVEGIWPLSVAVAGLFTDLNAELHAACQLEKPDDADNSFPVVYVFNDKNMFTITQGFSFVKLRVVSMTLVSGGLNSSYLATSGSTD